MELVRRQAGVNLKEKILVVTTGGTIGSTVENNVINVDDDAKHLLLQMYKELPEVQQVNFDIISPINVLSENVTIEDWLKIVNSIKEKNLSEYAGIIITYGTDTLGYFANVLKYMLHKVEIPVMLVSSNKVLTDPKANGLENFKVAVDFIVGNRQNGVFVAYKNTDGVVYVHKNNIKQITELSDDVYAVGGYIYIDPSFRNVDFKPRLEGILYIKPIVGMNYSETNLEGIRIVYMEAFHTGSIPRQAIELIIKCKEKNILFFMGVWDSNVDTMYVSGQEAIVVGAHVIKDMPHEAAITKLMIANGTFDTNEQIINFMEGKL